MKSFSITVNVLLQEENEEEAKLIADQFAAMAINYKSIGAYSSNVVAVEEIAALEENCGGWYHCPHCVEVLRGKRTFFDHIEKDHT